MDDLELIAVSTLTDDVWKLGTAPLSFDELLQLGELVATGHDNVIVTLPPSLLPQWKDAT